MGEHERVRKGGAIFERNKVTAILNRNSNLPQSAPLAFLRQVLQHGDRVHKVEGAGRKLGLRDPARQKGMLGHLFGQAADRLWRNIYACNAASAGSKLSGPAAASTSHVEHCTVLERAPFRIQVSERLPHSEPVRVVREPIEEPVPGPMKSRAQIVPRVALNGGPVDLLVEGEHLFGAQLFTLLHLRSLIGMQGVRTLPLPRDRLCPVQEPLFYAPGRFAGGS